MSTVTTTLPRIREGLTIQGISETEYVVKRADSREYFSVGPYEAFLLPLFDGQHTAEEICERFEANFHSSLSTADLQEFIDAVKPMGLFRRSSSVEASDSPKSDPLQSSDPCSSNGTATQTDFEDSDEDNLEDGNRQTASIKKKKKPRSLQDQSLLYYRVPLFDPDQSFGRLVQFVPFLWTRGFLFLIALAVLTALSITIEGGSQLAAGLSTMNTWSDAVTFLAVVIVCASIHEAAHGATLKNFGGEVHDSGVLFMFFTPCLYCNVSDAWLLREKWKRLAITAAGGISDLCLWAMGVFVWRLTVIGSPINQVALSVITMCGARSLINFNPLLRLDGYYLLSDWLSIPNLRTRAMDHWMGYLRWILWGAAKPPSTEHHRTLLLYGLIVWFFALTFLNVIFVRFFEYMGGQFGIVGLLFVGLLLTFACRRVFKGLFESELMTMLQKRQGRTAIWATGILAGLALLFGVPVRSTTSGDFEVRPGNIVQLHAPVAGVIHMIHVEDGAVVEEGQLLAEMKSSSLESEILKTEDLLAEVEANLRRLKAGARQEEIDAAHDRVRRLTEWYELGVDELEQGRLAHEQDLLVLDHRVRESNAEMTNAKHDLQHSEMLYRQGALAGAQLRQQHLELLQIESRLAQVQASLKATKALGVKSKEAEIARRAQELADAKAKLDLLQAGSRPEEIAAEEARRERASHELAFQKSRREKLKIVAPTSGIFSAPRLKERVGMAVMQDALFGTIEKPETSCVEIAVSEDEAAHLKAGQPVTLKARAIPFETFDATVESIAPVAQKNVTTGQNHVLVHCQIRNPDGRLKSGMTGFGRVTRGWNSVGMMLLTKGIRYFRTEFWW
jgi:multidrug efflux pump subunit AcrA (membrane-fusion protein)